MKQTQLFKAFKTILFVVFIMCSLCAQVFAQKQANIWYFGAQAGVDFNSGSPVALTNGQLNTVEGCSSIADANGSLLFYTDGITVWNKNHGIMPNGSGLNGNTSSTQSAMIIQKPGSANLYYIFVIDVDFCYSIVDITLNGGLGDVTSKNTLIIANCVSEKQCAVSNANGNGIWIMMHVMNSNTFNCFSLTNSGLNLVPVTTNIGIVHTGPYGQMKFSPDGNRIAFGVSDGTNTTMELFDFDKSTGIVSNNLPITTSYSQCYGLEFSPDNSKLYGTANSSIFEIYQWDLNAGSPAAILASATLIGTSGSDEPAGMQLAPDGKIYLSPSMSFYLDVINSPNDAGIACNYVHNAVYLDGGVCQLGLPEFLASFKSITFDNTCLGDTTNFDLLGSANLAGALWNFGDSLSGANNTSTLFSPQHYYAVAGVYNVQVITYTLSGGTDTINAQIEITALPQSALGNDTVICNNTTLLLNAGAGFDSYLWHTGSTASTFLAIDSGTYIVTITSGECVTTDSIVISTINCAQPVVAISSSDTSFCEKKCIDFYDQSTNNPTSWQWFFPGADSTTSLLQNPVNICYNNYGSFDVTLIACNAVGCDTLLLPGFINEYQTLTPTITQSNDTLYASPGTSYQWWSVGLGIIPGAVFNYYVPTQGGSYYVLVTDTIGCAGTSNVIVITGIEQLPGGNGLPITAAITINPNPNNGIFYIAFNQAPERDFSLRIINSLGQPIYQNREVMNTRLFPINLTAIDIVTGIYNVEIINSGKTYNTKFLIQ